MSNPQVLINASTYKFHEIEQTARSLAGRKRQIWCIGSNPEDEDRLRKLKIEAVPASFVADGKTDLLVVRPPVVFDRGALVRLERRAHELLLLRVVIPEKCLHDGVAYWTREFLRRNQTPIGVLANADTKFDAEKLPKADSHAR